MYKCSGVYFGVDQDLGRRPDTVNDLGLVFGDYEQNEISSSVLDFSQFKAKATTPMYFGRALGRLKDSIYFTHSHYSRFLQAADVVCFLCQRYESNRALTSHHDLTLAKEWSDFKKNINFQIQNWP